jgi:hypothetical protein
MFNCVDVVTRVCGYESTRILKIIIGITTNDKQYTYLKYLLLFTTNSRRKLFILTENLLRVHAMSF